MYAFLFDRRSLALLVAGVVLLGALLFFGGMMFGMGVEHDRSRSVESPQASSATVPTAVAFEPQVEPIRWRPADSPSLDDVPASTTLSSSTAVRGGSEAPPPPPASAPPSSAPPSSAPPPPPTRVVASPPPPPTAASTAPSATTSDDWMVQVIASSTEARAQAYLDELKEEGWEKLRVCPVQDAGVTRYAVQMCCWGAEAEAKEVADRWVAAGKAKPLVRTTPIPPSEIPPSDDTSSSDADAASGSSG